MISAAISRLVILLFGTLYPAYSSYKAVKTKNVKEYVKWMMYWIVFALFTCAETFTDVFLSFWFPFYYEIKIILVLWLLSPATRGSSILYRKFVHPQLTKREKEIDEYLARAKEQGYHTVVQLGTRGFNYASQMLLQTALKSGGTLVNHLRRSYSLSDLEPQGVAGRSRLHRALPPYSDEDQSDQVDTGADDESYPLDDLSEAHSTTALNRGEDSEPELSDKRYRPPLPTGMIRSRKGEDPSSGYSSAENLSTSAPSVGSPSLERDRPGLQTRGSLRSRSGKAVSTSHISGPTAPGKRTQHSEVSAYATLPRTTKRATRRKNTAVS